MSAKYDRQFWTRTDTSPRVGLVVAPKFTTKEKCNNLKKKRNSSDNSEPNELKELNKEVVEYNLLFEINNTKYNYLIKLPPEYESFQEEINKKLNELKDLFDINNVYEHLLDLIKKKEIEESKTRGIQEGKEEGRKKLLEEQELEKKKEEE